MMLNSELWLKHNIWTIMPWLYKHTDHNYNKYEALAKAPKYMLSKMNDYDGYITFWWRLFVDVVFNFTDCLHCHWPKCCYASAFRRRSHYVFGLSVCPSVRSPIYPLSTCTLVRWSIRPTVTVLQHARPTVRSKRFPDICRKMHGGNGLKFCMCILTTFSIA